MDVYFLEVREVGFVATKKWCFFEPKKTSWLEQLMVFLQIIKVSLTVLFKHNVNSKNLGCLGLVGGCGYFCAFCVETFLDEEMTEITSHSYLMSMKLPSKKGELSAIYYIFIGYSYSLKGKPYRHAVSGTVQFHNLFGLIFSSSIHQKGHHSFFRNRIFFPKLHFLAFSGAKT